MDSEVNKIFGRDFITGFFLPALFFVVGSACLLKFLGVEIRWLEINWRKPLEGTAFLGLLTWVVAIFLQSMNREIFRFAEGYWPLGLRRWLSWYQRRRFVRLHEKLAKLKAEHDDTGLARIWSQFVTKYPSKESLLLPTAFGNAVRAYEDYPRVIYGFESINGWTRLQALMSQEFREVLNRDRARVDLWLNLACLAFAFIVEMSVLAWQFGRATILWFSLPLIILIGFASARSRNSAIQYGEQVKAAFDIYLPALATKLGYVLSAEVGKNKQFWRAFSQVMVYRHPPALENMARIGLQRVPAPVAEDRDPAAIK